MPVLPLIIIIVISVFMLLFGINFNLFYLFLIKQFKRVFKSEELWTYLAVIGTAVLIITANILPSVESLGTALRQAGFQVISIITTTGFVTADFGKWPVLSHMVIVTLMFFGACAGSTGGGLKISRIIILGKSAFHELRRAINPRRVTAIKLDGVVVEKDVVNTTTTFFVIYMVIIGVSALLVSIDNFDLTTTLTSVITCISNVGPGLGSVGPVENFADLSNFSKLVLSADMLIGRLEVFPIMILFIPSTWKKST